MHRLDVQRCLSRVPVIRENDLERFTETEVLVHAHGNFTEELMRRKQVIYDSSPTTSHIVTVKRVRKLSEKNSEDNIKAFINEVTALKVLNGQEGFPFFYGIYHHSEDQELPAIVKGFIGELESPRYLTLSEPLKLCQTSLLPLATDADWLCVALYIIRLIETLHKHFFCLGDTTEEEFALDYSKLKHQTGKLSPILIDLGKISLLTEAQSEFRCEFDQDLFTFGNIIYNIGSTRNVPLLVDLGELCKNGDPKKRPVVEEVIKIIEKAYAIQMLEGFISQI